MNPACAKATDAKTSRSLRHIALNRLKQERTCKLGTFNKRLKAAWDSDYLFTVLATLFQYDTTSPYLPDGNRCSMEAMRV